jgi:hypothetical protein
MAQARVARHVRTTAWWSLVAISGFTALSALGGGIGMVVADGLSMPTSLLADSPFSTFTLPGLILALVVGGTQSAALFLLLTRRSTALLWSAVAGFGMLIWIVSEIGFLHVLMFAQLIYLVTGLLQLVLVFGLLGIVSWLPRQDRTRTRAASALRTPPLPAGSSR